MAGEETSVDKACASQRTLDAELVVISASEWVAQPEQRERFLEGMEALLTKTPSAADGSRVVSVQGLLEQSERQASLLQDCEEVIGALVVSLASRVPETSHLLHEQDKVLKRIMRSRAMRLLEERELDVLDKKAALAAAKQAKRVPGLSPEAMAATQATFKGCDAAKDKAEAARNEAKVALDVLGDEAQEEMQLLLDAAVLLAPRQPEEEMEELMGVVPAAAGGGGDAVGGRRIRDRVIKQLTPAAAAPPQKAPPAVATAAFKQAVDALRAVDRAKDDEEDPHWGDVVEKMPSDEREALLRPFQEAAKVLREQYDIGDAGLDELAAPVLAWLKEEAPYTIKPWSWNLLLQKENFD